MPYKSRKVRNKNCYKVYKNDKTKKVFAKCATKENAQRQMRLLRAIQNNKNFKPNARRNMGGKSRKNKTLKIKGGLPPPVLPPDQNHTQLIDEQIHYGDYVQLNPSPDENNPQLGDSVTFIDTRNFLNSNGSVVHRELFKENMTIIGNEPIQGYIVGMLLQPPRTYYHMIVTKGNNMIGVGLHFLLDTNYYTVSRHRINDPSM